MIVKMKKLTLLSIDTDREKTLHTLQDLGVLHVEHVKQPDGDDLETARNHLTYVKRSLDVLPKHTGAKPSGREAEQIVEDIWKLIQERKHLKEQLEDLEHERLRMLPFGSFDPAAVKTLAQRGIQIHLYKAGTKQDITVPDDCVYQELGRDKKAQYFVVVGQCEIKLDDVHEIRLPEVSLTLIEKRIQEIHTLLLKIEESMLVHAGDYHVIAKMVDETHDRVHFLEVRQGMGAAHKVVYLQGYFPVEVENTIKKAAEDNGWGFVIDDPGEDESVPTLIQNPKWIRPIEVVFDFIGIKPGYREIDISFVFLVFFSLFFAMLVGDAGYGLIFLLTTAIVHIKVKKLPRKMLALMYLMSVCTLIWGVLSGVYFGITKESIPYLQQFRLEWLGGKHADKNIMMLCFLIGAIQLTIARLWNALRISNTLQALAEIGWVCTTWLMFFVARFMIIGTEMPQRLSMSLGIVGVILIFVFMVPFDQIKKQLFNYVTLPLDLVNNFVDVVSYIRLYAVGMATFSLANAFNMMATDMMGGDNWFIASIMFLVGALIIFAGHALNIVLALMGVMVHGIRLNTLEFARALGMEWTGRNYNPFSRRRSTRT